LIRTALPLIVYVVINLASVAVACNRVLSAYELVLLTQMLLLFVYVVSNTRDRADIEFLATVALAGLIVEALVVLLMYVTGVSPNFLGLKARVAPSLYGGRLGGTVGSPNDAAAYLTLTLSLALGVLVSARTSMRLKRLAQIATPLGVLALVTTQSRGGWLAFTVSALIVATWAARHRLVRLRTLAFTVLVLGALIVPFQGQIAQRVAGSDNGSAHSRIELVTLASEMISAHPLLGLGLNNVGINIPNYAGPQFAGQWLYTVHDKYLLVWAEAGVGALIAFLWFLVATVRRGWRCAASGDPYLSPLALGLTAGIAGQLVHMAFDIFQSKPEVEGLWFAAAVLAAMDLIVRRERLARARRDRRPDRVVTLVRAPLPARA
jgi:O-antigen ligase